MVSLWGSKKGQENDNEPEEREERPTSSSRHEPPERRSHEADERTRLLPPRDSQGYLDPGDPAVGSLSAYLLHNVDVSTGFTL